MPDGKPSPMGTAVMIYLYHTYSAITVSPPTISRTAALCIGIATSQAVLATSRPSTFPLIYTHGFAFGKILMKRGHGVSRHIGHCCGSRSRSNVHQTSRLTRWTSVSIPEWHSGSIRTRSRRDDSHGHKPTWAGSSGICQPLESIPIQEHHFNIRGALSEPTVPALLLVERPLRPEARAPWQDPPCCNFPCHSSHDVAEHAIRCRLEKVVSPGALDSPKGLLRIVRSSEFSGYLDDQ